MSVSYSSRSPYKATPQINRYVQYLGTWVPPALTSSSDDQVITLPAKYNRRPDLLSYDFYGTPGLWWIFAVYNTNIIKDPIYDMVTGITIVIPNKSNLSGVL